MQKQSKNWPGVQYPLNSKHMVHNMQGKIYFYPEVVWNSLKFMRYQWERYGTSAACDQHLSLYCGSVKAKLQMGLGYWFTFPKSTDNCGTVSSKIHLKTFTYIHTYIQKAFLTRHFQRSQRGDTKICIDKNKIQMKNTREIHNQKLHLWKQMRFESLFENRHWFSTAHRRRQLVPNVGSGVSKCLVSSRFESPTADDWHSQSCGIRGRS